MNLQKSLILSLGALLIVGCGAPSAVNIELRKQNQELQEKVDTLTRTHEADQATIRGMQERAGVLPTLPTERLAKLFTVHGLELNRLTGGADLDREKPGDEGLKVYAVPTDDTGEKIKAAGSFVIEAFDLAAKPPEIGKWSFDTDVARQHWLGALLSYHYVFTCRWQTVPQHDELTIKVTFRDELTGREFSAQKVVKVQLP